MSSPGDHCAQSNPLLICHQSASQFKQVITASAKPGGLRKELRPLFGHHFDDITFVAGWAENEDSFQGLVL